MTKIDELNKLSKLEQLIQNKLVQKGVLESDLFVQQHNLYVQNNYCQTLTNLEMYANSWITYLRMRLRE